MEEFGFSPHFSVTLLGAPRSSGSLNPLFLRHWLSHAKYKKKLIQLLSGKGKKTVDKDQISTKQLLPSLAMPNYRSIKFNQNLFMIFSVIKVTKID